MQIAETFLLSYKPKFVKFCLVKISIAIYPYYLQKKKDEKCYFQVHNRILSTVESLRIKSRRALRSFSF